MHCTFSFFKKTFFKLISSADPTQPIYKALKLANIVQFHNFVKRLICRILLQKAELYIFYGRNYFFLLEVIEKSGKFFFTFFSYFSLLCSEMWVMTLIFLDHQKICWTRQIRTLLCFYTDFSCLISRIKKNFFLKV